jgi:hypothetical protein
MSGSCPTCGAVLQSANRAAADHRSGPVTSVVDPRSVPACPEGCRSADAGLIDAIRRAIDERLIVASGRRTSARCGVCASELDLPARATTRSVTVEPPTGAPFTLTFHLPVVRCGECGGENVPPELRADVAGSAFAACDVRDDLRPQGRFRLRRGRGGPVSPDRP